MTGTTKKSGKARVNDCRKLEGRYRREVAR